MSIEAITEKLLSEAKSESQKTLKEAELKISQLENDLEEKKRDLLLKEKEYRSANEKENTSRVQSKASWQVEQEIEKLKREALDEVFEKTLTKLNSLENNEYKKVLTKLLKKVEVDISQKITVFIPKNREKEVTEVLIERFGKDHKFEIKTDTNISGGVIISGSEFEYDLSFPSLLRNIKGHVEPEISKILFS